MTGPSLPASFLGSMASADAALGERIARGWLSFCPGMALVGEAAERVDVIPLQLLTALVELTVQAPDAQTRAMARLQRCQAQRQRLDAWGQQLLHAWQRQGDLDRALDWAGQRRASWSEALPAMRLHNRWHAAVLSLEMGQPDRAIPALAEFRGETGTGPLLDAIALGWWLDLSAAPQETLWSALVPLVQERLCLPLIPFIACHYAWCLGRAGQQQDLETLLDHCRDLARVAGPEAGWCWRPAGLTLVEAIGAAACGRRTTAWELLAPIRGWIDHAGGSDAQARVLHQTVRSLEPTRGGQHGLP